MGKWTRVVVVMLVVMLAVCLGVGLGQSTPDVMLQDNVYAAGVSYNVGGSPSVAGTALYARRVSESDSTYAYTAVDLLPATSRPFTVNTNISTGVAYKVVSIGKVPVYVPTGAGVSFNGTNTGWAWSTGAMAVFKYKDTGLRLMPNVRVVKSSVSGSTGYQPIVGFLVGWGS